MVNTTLADLNARMAKLQAVRSRFDADETISIPLRELEGLTKAALTGRKLDNLVSISQADIDGLISSCRREIDAATPPRRPPARGFR